MSDDENQPIVETDPYQLLFQDMPNVVTVEQMCTMLGGISTKTGRKLLQSGRIAHFRIGRFYKIPKLSIIDYLREIMALGKPRDHDTLQL
ncbi:helix-turn-helix domain-containing protein [Paenibacillus cellulositrophicus]|uniref:helix-turn-helix domain-containing protein n=1 Tax=Paenibacillus cellulositrophicus TaxID=562959 RepID=UPI00126708D3|nr:helix-turn-helix domain-containing protein [Paenibacillus cellulositrophicus]